MKIKGQDGRDLVIYMNDGPQDLVKQHTAGASLLLGDRIKKSDSKAKGHEFETLHCSVIYRYPDIARVQLLF